MKIRSSLKCLKTRGSGTMVIRRGKRVYVINKLKRRFNARQGG